MNSSNATQQISIPVGETNGTKTLQDPVTMYNPRTLKMIVYVVDSDEISEIQKIKLGKKKLRGVNGPGLNGQAVYNLNKKGFHEFIHFNGMKIRYEIE